MPRWPRTTWAQIWNYYTKPKDGHRKRAACKICTRKISYSTTTSNLKSHLKRKHNTVYNRFLAESIDSFGESASSCKKTTTSERDSDDDDSNCSVEIPAEVWNFFDRDAEADPGRARCILCSATVSLLDMVEHMKNEHPKVNTKTEILTEEFEAEDDALNDSKEKDGLDTEIIYVQDNSSYNKKLPPKRRQSRNFNVDRKRVSKYLYEEQQVDEVPLKKTKDIDKDDDEIGNFTTYVRCLLKQLPKDVCAKLQMDIINLIMTAKLRIPQQNAPETSKSMSNHMITVTAVDGTYMLVPPSVEKSVTVPTSDASERHNESGRNDPTADS